MYDLCYNLNNNLKMLSLLLQVDRMKVAITAEKMNFPYIERVTMYVHTLLPHEHLIIYIYFLKIDYII